MIVKAYVVLASDVTGDATLATELQDHVKQTIAPYKYPRLIEFVTQLPKTGTGKLQRFALRKIAMQAAASASAGLAAE
jgi:2-aminobenzoate-CoA ligase